MTKRGFNIFDYWPTMIVVAVILYATLAAHPVGADDLPPIPYLDKLIHAVMIGGLTGAVAFDWQRSHRDKRLTSGLMWRIFAGVILFGIVDELLQTLVDNNRQGDIIDFIADAVGAVIAVYTAPTAISKVLRLN